MDFTSILRPYFVHVAKRTDKWGADSEELQLDQLRSLIRRASDTEVGKRYGFSELAKLPNPYSNFKSRVKDVGFEDIREDVMRMIRGEKDVLWRGRCKYFAQSSGTSGGKSKYIPITSENLKNCHYKGAQDPLCHYLRQNPDSHIFSGKALILGGSFANELKLDNKDVRVGDLSATLINEINPFINLFRVPDKRVALMEDWTRKLPELVDASSKEDITNLSGVPSWFLTVCKEVMKKRGVDNLNEVWPNLEVFFHGGISFVPYRTEYQRITDPNKMHFVENYNASEGFFAVQNDMSDPAMLLTIDNDIFYEFIPLDGGEPLPIWELEKGGVYELLISSSNGLWRYHTGDTVRVENTAPVKITIAGRTKCFINAFGEELMQENADRAIAEVCAMTGSSIENYTAAPVFAQDGKRGRHQWYIEWDSAPNDTKEFAKLLDDELRKLNSDYDAKRMNTIFLDPLEITHVPKGVFDKWLNSVGNKKLGGQRKIPRLANDRSIADAIEKLIKP